MVRLKKLRDVNWRCRFGLHSWTYVIAGTEVETHTGRTVYFKKADYRICTVCEKVRDL